METVFKTVALVRSAILPGASVTGSTIARITRQNETVSAPATRWFDGE